MFEKVKEIASKLAYTACGIATMGIACAEEVTLPAVGQSGIADYITAGITAIAGVVGVALGGYVAFRVVRKALSWVNRALG